MTTKKEKKSVRKSKVVKSGSPASKTAKRANSAGERNKVLTKSPVAGEIDKEKMAAFFSAGGLKEPVAVEKKVKSTKAKPEPVAAVTSETSASVPPVEKKTEPEVKVAEVSENITPEVSEVKVVSEDQKPEKQNLKDQTLKDQTLKEKKGEIKMTTAEPVKSSSKDSGSISILPIFVILFCMAAFWLYYVSSAPLQKAAATMVEEGQTQILKLEKKVKGLQAIIAGLQVELKVLQNSAQQNQAVTVKKAAAAKTVKDSSFDKAPVPFWRNYQHPQAKQLEKLNKNKKTSTVKAPVAKVDSFSKAPVPFWRKANGAQPVAKATKDGARHDSSFDKAPIPFWRK